MSDSTNMSITASPTVSEVELLERKCITPEDVLSFSHITEGFLCSPCDKIFSIDFLKFSVRDIISGSTLFEISKPKDDLSFKQEDLKSKRCGRAGAFVRYHISAAILQMKIVGATIEFKTGEEEVKSFRMIERHFYKDKLLKTFDFEFGYCIPNSSNTCEHIYQIPRLPSKLIQDMINNPFETRSDSFYFVDGQLAMHNKADYSYNKCEQN